MIINVTREADAHLWQVAATEDDGSPVSRNGNDVPFRPSSCAHGVVWDAVGRLVALANHHDPAEPVRIVYRDDNGMTARVARARTKTFTLDMPHRVWAWIPWRNVGNAMLIRAHGEAEILYPSQSGQQEMIYRMSFPAVPGVRAALDRLVELVDDVRMTHGQEPHDFFACQTAIERLDKVFRELSTPWCDTCKRKVVWKEHPARWAHVTEEYPLGVPESLDTAGHEVTAREWNQA